MTSNRGYHYHKQRMQMTELKILIKEMIFGVDQGKCKVIYDLYLNQIGLQSVKITPVLTEQGLTIDQVNDMFSVYNIFGYLPFIHFTVLFHQGLITKRELVFVLYYMCEMSKQPHTLVPQIFSHMDSILTDEMMQEANGLESAEYKHFFEEYGILPLLIVEYKDACLNGGNIYANVIDLLTTINEPEPESDNE